MSVSLFVVVFLADGTSAGQSRFFDTLGRSLDPAKVHIEPRVAEQHAPEVLDQLSEHHPVVFIEWQTLTTATVRSALKPHEWSERTLSFARHDPIAECARSIAFVVASMMPQWQLSTPSLAASVEAPSTLSTADIDQPQRLLDGGADQSNDTSTSTPASVAPARVAPQWLVSVTAGADVPRARGGGGLEAAWCPVEPLCVGPHVSLLVGPVVEAAAVSFDVRLLAVADVRLFPRNARIGMVGRVGAGALYVLVARGEQSLARWSAAASLEAGPVFRAGPFELALTLGAHFNGSTTLRVETTQIAEFAPVQGAARVIASIRPELSPAFAR